jgi:hypothetical protein
VVAAVFLTVVMLSRSEPSVSFCTGGDEEEPPPPQADKNKMQKKDTNLVLLEYKVCILTLPLKSCFWTAKLHRQAMYLGIKSSFHQ